MQHLAIIMDGNGRWATQRGLGRGRGHIAGARNAFNVIAEADRRKIPVLSLFAFSKENWARPEPEVKLLMRLLAKALVDKIPFFTERDIRVKIIGDRAGLPVECIDRVEEKTRANAGLRLLLAVNYSGQWDIRQAARRDPLNPEKHLSTADVPPPDLILRTGGERRISNFYLWQAAYAEIYFEEKYWPDFGAADLDRALARFGGTERRFGKIRDTRTRCR